MSTANESAGIDEAQVLPVTLLVHCGRTVFAQNPVEFDRWATINYLIGPNGSGKTTLFDDIMTASRQKWPTGVKILGTGRLGPIEKSVKRWIGDLSGLFNEERIEQIYGSQYSGQDTAHEAFQLLEKRLDLRLRVLGFLRHVFKKSLHFKSTRQGLQVLGASDLGEAYPIIDECHGLKELITILTFLYDDRFSVLGIDEPELHLHPQFQRFLLDELRAVAGQPGQPGKKLIFLVTHSPILLDIRTLADLASIVVFSHSAPPKRATPLEFSNEERLKVRQALPSFHAAQRELLFSNSPIVVEGPSDAAVLMNLATKLELPLGAAGIGITSMGGKYQLLAFRALLKSLSRPNARFVLDLDAVTDARTLHCLDEDSRVVEHLATSGHGDRTISKLVGDLIGLLRAYASAASGANKPLIPLAGQDVLASERELAIILRKITEIEGRAPQEHFDRDRAKVILGKVDLIRATARFANVLILSKGPIEAYYASPPNINASEFDKQRALQSELETIWTIQDIETLRTRYAEVLEFFRDAGLLKIPISDLAREPIADLIHLLQSEIFTGRVQNLEQAKQCARVLAEGYWDICELVALEVKAKGKTFSGSIQLKAELGGETVQFNDDTRPYELTVRMNGEPRFPITA